MDSSVVLFLGLGALAALILVAGLYRLASWRRSLQARRRGRHAVRGEHAAEALLRRRGYTILERQVARTWIVSVAGKRHEVALRADLLVAREGARLVAEVKTGSKAPRIENASTRRQLLEYLLAYRADGLLLVEPDRGEVSSVEFPLVLVDRHGRRTSSGQNKAAPEGAAFGS